MKSAAVLFAPRAPVACCSTRIPAAAAGAVYCFRLAGTAPCACARRASSCELPAVSFVRIMMPL